MPNYKPVLQIRCHSRRHRPENENVESSSQSSFSLFTLITPFVDSAAFKAYTPTPVFLDGVRGPELLRLFCKKTQALLLIRPETKINSAASSSSAFPSLFVWLFHTPARRLICARLVINVLALLLGEEFAAVLKCWQGRDKWYCRTLGPGTFGR